jgi:hypothetical protein
VDRIRFLAAKYGWWMALSMALAVAIGVAFNLILLLVLYAGLNTAGTAFYLSGLDIRSQRGRRRWRIYVALTVLQLPAGIIGVFASPGGTSPTDTLVGDPRYRDEGGTGVWMQPHQHSGGGPG